MTRVVPEQFDQARVPVGQGQENYRLSTSTLGFRRKEIAASGSERNEKFGILTRSVPEILFFV
jgi:hypothetical protein